MFNLALCVLVFLGIGQANAAPACGDTHARITQILDSAPSAAVAAADPARLAEAHSKFGLALPRTPVPGQTPAMQVSSFQNDVNAAVGKLGRALNGGAEKEADALLVIEHQLQGVKAFMAETKYEEKAKDLIRIKKELLQLKFLKKREVKDLSYEELLAIQQELLAQRSALRYTKWDKPGPEFAEEEQLLKDIELVLKKTPKFREAQSLALAKASEDFKATQSAAAIQARMRNQNPAAHPLTSDKHQEVAAATSLLKSNPRRLTEAQVKDYRILKAELEEKKAWKSTDSMQSGMLPKDQEVTDQFLRQVEDAVKAQAPGNVNTAALAETQNRVIRHPKHDVNTTNSFGQMGRQALVNTHAARNAPDSETKIQTALHKVSPGSGNSISNRGEYLPIIDSGDVMGGLVAKLQTHNITQDQLVSINVISTLKPGDIDSFPGDYARAEQFYRQISKQGVLDQIHARLDSAEKTAIDKLISFFGALEKDYIPPARRISP
jgi:hypothetical protein